MVVGRWHVADEVEKSVSVRPSFRACVLNDVQFEQASFFSGLYTGAYPGFQRGGCLRSGPIRKVGGGGGGGH